jgi:hypothetical protein
MLGMYVPVCLSLIKHIARKSSDGCVLKMDETIW